MTKENKAFADAQHAMGFIQAAIADLPDRMETRAQEALGYINQSLETLLELAENPEVVVPAEEPEVVVPAEEPEMLPTEEPSSVWHRTRIMGQMRVLPELNQFVLTWSQDVDRLEVLKCTDIDKETWRDVDGLISRFPVDYWMSIPLILTIEPTHLYPGGA